MDVLPGRGGLIRSNLSLTLRGYRLASTKPTIEVVEQIDIVDEQGHLITTYEKKVSPSEL